MRIRPFLPAVFLLTLCIFLSGILEIYPIDEYAVLSVTNEGRNDPDDYLKPPNRILKRKSSGSPVHMSGVRSRPQVTYNVVSGEVTNLRCLIGGGRKIIRHDCMGEDPPSLEVVFTRDVNRPEMRLYDALSSDNGASWLIAGPLSPAELDTGRDSNHVIDFNDDLTYLCYTEMEGVTWFAYMLWTQDAFKCVQAFNPFVVMSPPDSLDENCTQLSMTTNQTAYLSFIDFIHGNPHDIYFRKSTNNGNNWGEYMNISETIGTNGFDAVGYDGPLILDSDGDFIAALTFVNLDPTWATANGFPTAGRPTYPAYTQSTDGGVTWADLRLVHGNDGSLYPRGHSGNTAFDDSLHYIGGTNDVPWTAFANCQDNCVLTSDGIAHLTYTMRDTTFGYVGVWHTLVRNDSITSAYIGFPENQGLEGASGVADMPGLAESAEGHVVIGWTESMQGTGGGLGDICMHAIPAGAGKGNGPVNVTNTLDDDEYFQRIVDRIVPTTLDNEYYVDWLFFYYGEGSNAADSTLWHLQTTISTVGIKDKIKYNNPIPRDFALSQNYPNPFNPTTTISFDIPREAGEEQHTTLTVYDLRGRHVTTLVDEDYAPGTHRVVWDGRNEQGQQVSSGIYLYTLKSGDKRYTRKMIVVK